MTIESITNSFEEAKKEENPEKSKKIYNEIIFSKGLLNK
jgi:hypothetical protein